MPSGRDRPLILSRRLALPATRLLGVVAVLMMALPLVAGGSNRPEDRPTDPPAVSHVATYTWRMDDPDFGGFSGIEITRDGQHFHAVSDRGTIRWGTIERDEQGRITRMGAEGWTRLRDATGKPLPKGRPADAEGIAIAPDGTIWISFEGVARVVRYDTPESPARPLPRPDAFARMQVNSSLEALAIDDQGTIYTLPERSGALRRPFPVWRWRDGEWDQPFAIPRSGNWLAVGADFGPDGRFYLLERDFMGLLGFLSRVRRFDLTENGAENETILLQTRPLQYDNLEGISVWDDGQGIRITMISDDNFHFLQRTQIVEYRVAEQGAVRQP